ncbi:hypothetical protein C8R43DRAFT_465753 [Mycena crocata]|nr:hypothetical protein C8R43DRAFT_465753 [Mycena crocata]
MSASTSTKKSNIRACASCRKAKARCELFGPSYPISHNPRNSGLANKTRARARCRAIDIAVGSSERSYEETLVPTPPPPANTHSDNIPVQTNHIPIQADHTAPRPELVPFPAAMPDTNLWELVDDDRDPIDWSAPMLAMHTLTRIPAMVNPPSSIGPQRPLLVKPYWKMYSHRMKFVTCWSCM